MTTDAVVEQTATSTAQAAPVADTASQTSSAPDASETSKAAPEGYKIPDSYKEKAWTQKIKSEDDLWKQLDNAQELIGRKRAVPDFEKAAPEEIEEFLSGMRPTDKSAYNFGDADPEFVGPVGDILLAAGVTAYQGNKIIEAYQAHERAQAEAMVSAEGFKETMAAKFGDKYDATVSRVVGHHKQHLSEESQAIFDGLPNVVLGAIYELTENMAKAYGATETGSPGDKSGPVQPSKPVEQVRADLRAKLREMDARPHTEAEKQKLKNELDATYRK